MYNENKFEYRFSPEKEQHTSRVIMVTGLGIGEETKGSSVEWLARKLGAHTIIRTGGMQAGHQIVKDDGREQSFSHFGAASFERVETYLQNMLVSPVELFNEALELENNGIENPFDLITIDYDCLGVTPYHEIMNLIREKLRGDNKKGTVGMGAGEAVRDSKLSNDLAIMAYEFGDDIVLREKVINIKNHKLNELSELLNDYNEIPEIICSEVAALSDDELIDNTVASFVYLADLVKIAGKDEFNNMINKGGNIISESSHGALLHPWYGMVPFVTQVDPTGEDLKESLIERGFDGEIQRIGVSRCYMTRHGAGPLVSYSAEMTESIHETHNNTNNEWLGEFRNGQYDIVAMKYSLAISGGANNFFGLMISYLDILNKFEEWQVCKAYEYIGETDEDLDMFFDLNNDKQIVGIKVAPNTRDIVQYQHQVNLTKLLQNCKPVIDVLKPNGSESLEEVFLDYVEDKLGIPVVAVAHGPKMSQRTFRQKRINYVQQLIDC